VEEDGIGFLNKIGADNADIVDKRHLLITFVVEPDEMYDVWHHVV